MSHGAAAKSTSRGRERSTPHRARVRTIARLFITFLAVVVIVDALVGDRGFLAVWRADKNYVKAERELAAQRFENERLRHEISRMKTDAAVEELAREELNLIRKGEKLFIITDLPAPVQ
ncbi:MAG TPA: septum formation initiator family protein [Vicinamibacterales bacterium]|jgi:cell division protein FtsB|nr:septum formation initiator family protein [Vicinamibacterales bacterium]